ncbi:MAG: TlpA family protein disulfide reductase [Caldiserica bacterium]|nr:TlpA family protein disulfide reductase [Caldisericota bacterium]
MAEKNLRKKRYLITGVVIVALGILLLWMYSYLKTEKSEVSRGEFSYPGRAAPPSVEKFMRAMTMQKPENEMEAPDFTLLNLEGKKVSLKDYRGKVVLLNFMATWCHWCRKEMPHLQKLYDRFKGSDFIIVSVFSDREGAKVVVPFMKKSGFTFSLSSGLLDPTGKVTAMYRVTGTPTSYLIDRKGMIIGRGIGYREWSSPAAINLIKAALDSGSKD